MISRLIAIWLLFCGVAAAQVGQIPAWPPVQTAPIASGNSLIFTAASSQYLQATGSTSANQQKFSISFWEKLGTANAQYMLYSGSDGSSNNRFGLSLSATDQLTFFAEVSGTTVLDLITTATFTDTTSWHHVFLGVDTTQATASNRALLYFDGTLVTSFGTSTYPTQNTNLPMNFANPFAIGRYVSTGNLYFNGKIAQFYNIDGQQLTPSSFITGTPGVPKTYSGTYTGHFDFFLPFSNGTSTTTLGADSSGESNNWTLANMTTANQSSDYP